MESKIADSDQVPDTMMASKNDSQFMSVSSSGDMSFKNSK